MSNTVALKRGNKRLLSDYVPILSWLPAYQRGWLRPDFLAGLTVVALLVPEGMAYAELAGLPPQTAFYAAIPALVLFAVFGTSRQLVVATSSTIAVMSAATVSGLAPAGTAEYIALSAALALLVGLISALAGLLKLGAVSQFFSESVLTGFVFGLAMVIAIKQVPKLFGLESGEGNFFERLWDIIINLPETHLLTLGVGLTSLALMLVLEKRFEKIPAALVVLIYGIVIGTIFDPEASGVHIVGEIPAGLALPQLPDVSLNDLLVLLPGALGISLVVFAEAIGPARQFASKHGYELDADQELIGYGAANLGAGLFQGYSVGASLSKSAANDNAGAKTQMSALFAAGFTALVALLLTPLFHNLPEATLAAIVVVAVMGMMNVVEMRRLRRLNRGDFVLAMVALLAVLIFEVLVGLLIAVVISLLALILRAAAPNLSVLGRHPRRLDFGDVERHPDYITLPGLLVVRPNEGLFFANATPLKEAIVERAKATDPPTKAVLLNLEMSYKLDVPSMDVLAELKEELERLEIDLVLARVHGDVRDGLDQSGVTDVIGAEAIHASVSDSVLSLTDKGWGTLPGTQEVIAAGLLNLRGMIDLAARQESGERRTSLEQAGRCLEDAVDHVEDSAG